MLGLFSYVEIWWELGQLDKIRSLELLHDPPNPTSAVARLLKKGSSGKSQPQGRGWKSVTSSLTGNWRVIANSIGDFKCGLEWRNLIG